MTNEKTVPKEGFPWEPNDSISYLIKMISISMRREIEMTLRPIGLTPQQSQALRLVSYYPGVTHSDVERILNIEKSSVTSLINGMVKKGWVFRRHHTEDARIKQIFLTEEGIKINEEAVPKVEQVKNLVYQSLTPEEVIILRVLLQKALKANK